MDQNNNMQPSSSTGLAVASMVLGIISLVLFCIPYICFPTGIIGIILGAVSLGSKKGGKGMAIAGLVCSAVSMTIYIVLAVSGAALLASLGF